MKLFLLAAAGLVALSGADLGAFKSVYLLPMSNGLDQYLAAQLTSGGIMQVVTDPKKADAVFTDKLGESFEDRMNEIYGHVKKDENQQPSMQPVTRGHGAIFLVDPKSRAVIWSIFEPIKGTMPDQLNRTADKIAKRLEKDRKAKAAPSQ
ncbi:MAG TPA: hypothetical protein VMG40_20975 [Bryobacteraceae bacterium]|nr:hypothetical protein [Bryobacteraceae bacterium]